MEILFYDTGIIFFDVVEVEDRKVNFLTDVCLSSFLDDHFNHCYNHHHHHRHRHDDDDDDDRRNNTKNEVKSSRLNSQC